MPLYMLDTGTSSCIMGRSDENLLRRLHAIAVDDVCISAITKAELLYSVEVSPRRLKDQAAVKEFLQYVQVLDFPSEASLDFARIKADLKVRGKAMRNDLLVAAHARFLGLALVTENTREFERVIGLKVESWV
jgi:tRNA(fMet)-specific endonuclease VapC